VSRDGNKTKIWREQLAYENKNENSERVGLFKVVYDVAACLSITHV